MKRLHRPLFTGIPSELDKLACLQLLPEELMGIAGNNTGNFLFVKALENILSRKYSGHENFANKYSDGDCDYIAIPAANWISSDSDLSYMVEVLEKYEMPILVVGLGVQLSEGENRPQLKEGTRRFLDIISERSVYISVRGETTHSILHDLGVKNTWITGCPSLIGLRNRCDWLPDNFSVRNLDNVVLQGTRHGFDSSIFEQKKQNLQQLSIYRLAYILKQPMLLQSEHADIFCMLGRCNDSFFSAGGVEYLETVYQDSFKNVNFYLKNYGLAFWDANQWIDRLASYKALIGTRIHGVISALLSGIPALLLVHDSRTRELAETLNIPYKEMSEFGLEITSDELIGAMTDLSFKDFKDGMAKYTTNFKSFFDNNNISYLGCQQ